MTKTTIGLIALLTLLTSPGVSMATGCRARVSYPVVTNTVVTKTFVAQVIPTYAVKKVFVLDPLFVAGYSTLDYGVAVFGGTPPTLPPLPQTQAPASAEKKSEDTQAILAAIESLGKKVDDQGKRIAVLEGKKSSPPVPKMEKEKEDD